MPYPNAPPEKMICSMGFWRFSRGGRGSWVWQGLLRGI